MSPTINESIENNGAVRYSMTVILCFCRSDLEI